MRPRLRSQKTYSYEVVGIMLMVIGHDLMGAAREMSRIRDEMAHLKWRSTTGEYLAARP